MLTKSRQNDQRYQGRLFFYKFINIFFTLGGNMVITDREFEIRFPGCSPKVSTLRALFQLVSDPLFIGYIVAVVMVFGMIDQPVQSAIGMRTSTFLTLVVGAVF